MNVRVALKCQYHAAMAMLKAAIECCPGDLWAGGDHPVPFWRVVYHTLFYTDLYLQHDHKSFRPWEHHREDLQHLGKPCAGESYTRGQLLEYWEVCDRLVDVMVDQHDLSAAQCGFPWYKLPKLDHQINNIRHIQHHAALLSGRLRQAKGTDIRWVGRV
jgi:hypothetical protein